MKCTLETENFFNLRTMVKYRGQDFKKGNGPLKGDRLTIQHVVSFTRLHFHFDACLETLNLDLRYIAKTHFE